jgi:phosphoadenosine phosphosulfate reductase
MDERWRETFRLHARMEQYEMRLHEANVAIQKAIAAARRPYVAFSGGKDSTVMLHLVLQHAPEIMVHHWDYGIYMPRPLEEEIRSNAVRIGIRDLRIETSPLYDSNPQGPVWYREYFDRIVPRYIAEGFDRVFVGLRSEESGKRRRRIKAGRSLSPIGESWPIHDWTWMDVWAFIVSNELPYPSYYDVYGPVIGWDRVRFSTLFDPEFDKLGCTNIDGVLSWKYRNA